MLSVIHPHPITTNGVKVCVNAFLGEVKKRVFCFAQRYALWCGRSANSPAQKIPSCVA